MESQKYDIHIKNLTNNSNTKILNGSYTLTNSDSNGGGEQFNYFIAESIVDLNPNLDNLPNFFNNIKSLTLNDPAKKLPDKSKITVNLKLKSPNTNLVTGLTFDCNNSGQTAVLTITPTSSVANNLVNDVFRNANLAVNPANGGGLRKRKSRKTRKSRKSKKSRKTKKN